MKHLSLFLVTVLLSLSGYAQTTAAAYNFSASSGTFSSISSTGTILGSTFFGDDRNQSGIPIGFTFTFCGTGYTQLSACSNGWLSLINSTSTILTNSAGNVIAGGFLMPYWDDLNGASGGSAYYQTTGTSPNRIFTFEWVNWGTWTGSGVCNMQVKLYETTNAIEYIYGTSTYASHSATIGIANSTTDYQTLPNVSATPTPSSTTFTTSLTTSPASGQVYRWYPCPVTATAANSGPVCPGATLALTGTSSGTSYTWSGPGGFTSTQLSPVISSVSAAGVYTLAASDGTCTTTTTTTVTLYQAPAAPVVTPTVDTICNGNIVSLTASLPPSAINLIPFEGWESGVPTAPATPVDGWTTTATSTAYITWSTSGSYPTASPHSGSRMADFHSWSYSSINAALISPSFSMAGITGGQVTFWMYRDMGYNTSTYDNEGITIYMNTSASTSGATSLGYVPRRGGLAISGGVTGTSTVSANGWYQYTCTIPATYTGATNYLIFSFNSNFGNDIYLDDINVTGNQHIAPPVWTPVSYLYTNAGATTAYNTGDTVLTVYAHPTSVSSLTTVYYVATITNGTCTAADTAQVTITVGLPAITGSTSLCMGTSSSLSDPLPAGLWSTSNSLVATIDPATGMLYANNPGVDTVFYNISGCYASAPVTVTTLSTPITGNTVICSGGLTSALANATPGGTWTTNNAAVASVNTTGVITSGTTGSAVIRYALPSGCADTALVTTVTPPPAITGSPNVCYNGGTTTLSVATAGGGTWSSSNASVAAVNSSGVVTGLAAGSATISYTTLPGCFSVMPLTLLANPAPVTGTTAICESGGSTVLSDATPGGTWSSSAPATASVNASTGVVTGGTFGTAVITYTAANNCYSTANVIVNVLPAPITGAFVVCQTNTISLSSATSGGTWTSGAPGIATVNSSGVVGGVVGGIAPVSYSLATGCYRTANVTVRQLPAAITGNSYVCNGGIATLSDAVAGGAWSTNNPTILTVDSLYGILSGHGTGLATVTYTTGPGSCYATKAVTVSPVAAPVVNISPTPSATVCAGTSVTFSSSVTGGGSAPLYVWSVNNTIISGDINYSYTPANGDVVRLWVLSNYECAIPDTSSSSIVMVVNPIVTPGVTFGTGMGDTVCQENVVTFTPTPVAGGTAPVYQWSVNGAVAGSGSTYSYIPANGDVVNVVMTSNAPCRTATTASASHILTVSPYVTPMVTLTSSLGATVCEGYPDVFTATQLNGGTAPVYQWTVNGVAAGTGPVYSYAPANGDLVQVTLTSNFPCLAAPTAIATTEMTVLPVTQPVGNVYASPGYIIPAGVYDTFYCQILSGGGTAPQYQWLKNSIPIYGATTNMYVTNDLHTGDSITCLVTNTDQCSGVSVFNYVIVTVGDNVGVNNVNADAANIVLAPNPNNGTFRIYGNIGTATGEVNIEIADMLGKIIYRGTANVSGGVVNDNISLDSDLANGMYLLNIRAANITKSIHFSIQK